MKFSLKCLNSKKTRYISTLLLLNIFFILSLFNSIPYTRIYGLAVLLTGVFVFLLILIRCIIVRNFVFFIFFCYIFLYFWPLKSVVVDSIYLSYHNQTFDYPTLMKTSLIFLFFIIIVNGFIVIPEFSNMPRNLFINNDFFFYLLYIIGVFIVLFAKTGDNIFKSGGYSLGNVSNSSLNEYILIIFITLFFFSNNKRSFITLLYVLCICYGFKNLLFGGRIELIMVCLLIFTLHLQYKISTKFIIFLLIFGIYLLNLFSSIRANPAILFSMKFKDLLLPNASANTVIALGNNEGDVFYAGQRILLLIENGYLSITDRISSFIKYLISPFVPTNILGDLANLSAYRRDVFSTGGGGLAPVFFYAFLSYFGVLFFGIFIARVLSAFTKGITLVKYSYIVLVISTVPRWFAYYPLQLIKLSLIGALFAFFVKLIDKGYKRTIK